MPLPGVCPACGATFSLEQALTDAEARAALAAALAVPPALGAAVTRYAGLFAPPGRKVQWRKLTRVLADLTTRINTGQVAHRGTVRAAPLAIWQAALDAVLSNHEAGSVRVPLADHAYLDAIAWEMAAPRPGTASAPTPRPPDPHAPKAAATDAATRRGLIGQRSGLRRQIELLEIGGHPVSPELRRQLSALEDQLREVGA